MAEPLGYVQVKTRKMAVEKLSAGRAPYNPREIGGDQKAALWASLDKFSLVDPLIWNDKTGTLVGGHQRLDWLEARGATATDVTVVSLGKQDEIALNIALNDPHRMGSFTGGVGELLAEMQERSRALFDELRFEPLRLEFPTAAEVEERKKERSTDGEITKVPAKPDSKLGEVYELGPHRLICGDSTDPTVWSALLGDERVRLMWTDPPYGMNVNKVESPEEAKRLRRRTDGKMVENDNLDEDALSDMLRDAFTLAVEHCEPGSSWYVAAPSGPLHQVFGAVLRGLRVWRWSLIWVKDRFVLGRGDYHCRHESIFYGWVPGAAHYFVDDRTQDTIFEFDRPSASADHPTMKPIELVSKQIENSGKPGWIVVDPFSGSGTTLMAAAQNGMVARCIELSPAYCDVIRRRWTTYAEKLGIDPGPGALR